MERALFPGNDFEEEGDCVRAEGLPLLKIYLRRIWVGQDAEPVAFRFALVNGFARAEHLPGDEGGERQGKEEEGDAPAVGLGLGRGEAAVD